MRLPRDIDAQNLIKALQHVGYRVIRQSGSHVRLTTDDPKSHSITVPNHSPLKLGTLSAILADVAAHLGTTKEALVDQLFN